MEEPYANEQQYEEGAVPSGISKEFLALKTEVARLQGEIETLTLVIEALVGAQRDAYLALVDGAERASGKNPRTAMIRQWFREHGRTLTTGTPP